MGKYKFTTHLIPSARLEKGQHIIILVKECELEHSRRETPMSGFLPSFGVVTHRFRTSGTLSPPCSVHRTQRHVMRPPRCTMGHHFQVDFFKSSLRILFTHVLLYFSSSSSCICVIELLHRRERSHCLPGGSIEYG